MTTTTHPRQPIRPIDLSEARAILQPLAASNEFWMAVVYGMEAPFLVEVETKYYSGEKNRDFTLITFVEDGQVFAIVAARKRHMLAYQLKSMLRQYADVHITERELLRGDAIIIAPGPANIRAALASAKKLLFDAGDLALSE